MIISFVNSKGGSGKTTLVTQISTFLAMMHKDKKICIIDADDQLASAMWYKSRKESQKILPTDKVLPNVYLESLVPSGDSRTETMINLITQCDEKYDYVLIDTKGVVSGDTRIAITLADLVIIPTNPVAMDIWVMTKGVYPTILEETENRRVYNDGASLPALVIFNRTRERKLITQNSDLALARDLVRQDCPELIVSDNRIADRKQIPRLFEQGLGIGDDVTSDQAAALEFEDVAREVDALLSKVQQAKQTVAQAVGA